MSVQYSAVRPRVLAVSIASALGLSGAFIIPAHAQQNDAAAAQGAPSLEEVVVTGSRIVRRDYQSNSPIVTVNSEDFETQTGLNVESYLNQLPQYNPAASPVTTDGDVQITPVNSVGIASISLRGFGANRSLVLVDGKRMVPINALMVTDINGIPSALIERVETITGGASAVYGADAVGGVTNFILKDDFEGFDIDLQTGGTEAGDGEESRLSMVVGTNFDDGRGNVTLGVEAYQREAAFEAEHDIYRERWADPNTSGTFAGFLQGVNGYSCFPNCPPLGTVDALFDTPAGARVTNVFYGGAFGSNEFKFNADGTIFKTDGAVGLSRYNGPVDGREYARQLALDTTIPGVTPTEFEGLKWNHQRGYISAPQDRYSFFASGNFDVNDRVQLFARSTFAQSKTRTILFGTDVISGWEGTVPYDPVTDSPIDPSLDYGDPAVVQAVDDAILNNNLAAFANPNFIATGQAGAGHPVPAELAILLNSRPDPTGVWQPQWYPDDSLPPRNTFNTNEVWQVEAGLNVDIGGDWTGEFYVSHGESSTYNIAGGNLSLERYRSLIVEPDYGRGAKISGNEDSIRPNFGAGDITCTSGFYDTFFSGDRPLSDDCFNAINATLQTRTQNQQDIIELNLQGPVFDLPAGEVRAAAGFQRRRNAAQFYPDILQSEVSFNDQVVGVYPTGYLDATTSVNDYYVEGLIPIISGKTGAQQLELELGARYSDYQHTDKETTWKSLINWQINDWARLRGGFNRATRAPNLGELFLNPQEIFTGGGNFGDACGLRSNAPYGAGGAPGFDDPAAATNPNLPPLEIAPGQTAEGAKSTQLICEALMGGPGSPAATEFYENAAAGGSSAGFFAWVMQQGNRNLESETADEWTFGMVANSPFEKPWLSNATLSLDWYKVNIDNAIMLYSLDYAAFECFGTNIVSTPEAAAAQALSSACQLLPRDQVNGAALTTTISYDNQATIETSGFDVALNWFLPLANTGTFGINVQATFLDYYRTKQSPLDFDVETDWKGSLGPDLSGTNAGAYDYRLFTNFNYSRNNWNVGLRWRHLPSVWSAGHASEEAIKENNARVAAGGSGIILGYTPGTDIETAAYDVFDLSFNYTINSTISLRGGVTNLFDTEPELTGASAGYSPDQYPAQSDLNAVCGGAPGCQNPTRWSLANPGNFSPGYYDTMGRRFFVGMNVRF